MMIGVLICMAIIMMVFPAWLVSGIVSVIQDKD